MKNDRTPRTPQANLLPTLFERLKDDQPFNKTSESPEDWVVNAAKMRELVRNNLIDILNVVNLDHKDEIDLTRYPHVADSVLNFGIPPVAGRYLSEVRWDDIEKNIRKAVLRFEPRLIPDSLSVVPPADIGKQRTGNTLRFLIKGMIHMDPLPLEFVLQSYLDLETSTFEGQLKD